VVKSGRRPAPRGPFAKVLWLLAAGTVLSMSASVGFSTTVSAKSQPKTVRVAYLALSLANPYVAGVIKAMGPEAAKLHAKVTNFNANSSATTQYQQCEDTIATRAFQALVISAVSPSIVPCVKQAVKAGIKVVGINKPLINEYTYLTPEPKGVSGLVVRLPQADSDSMAALMVGACAKFHPCHVGLILGLAGSVDDTVRGTTVTAAAAKHHFDIVATGYGDYDETTSQTLSENMLTANPDINVFVVAADQMALGVQRTLQGSGDLRKVLITGVGASIPGIAAVRSGLWYGTTTWLPSTEGSKGLYLAVKAVRSKKPIRVGVDEVAASGLPNYFDIHNIKKYPKFKGEWAI